MTWQLLKVAERTGLDLEVLETYLELNPIFSSGDLLVCVGVTISVEDFIKDVEQCLLLSA